MSSLSKISVSEKYPLGRATYISVIAIVTTFHYQTKRVGRPKLGFWSNELIPAVEEIAYDVDLDLKPYNSVKTLEQCLCIYCKQIIIGPILLKCEHGSCRNCFIENNFKKEMKGTECMRCKTPITAESDLSSSGVLQKCIDNLNVKCNQGMAVEIVWDDGSS